MITKENIFSQLFTMHNLFILLDVTITLVITTVIIKVVNKLIMGLFKTISGRYNDINFQKQLKTIMIIIKSFLDLVLMSLAILHILNDFGIDIKPILATAGVLGLAVGFGAQKFIEDIISGILLLMDGQLRVGDIVKIKGVMGCVEKLNLRLVVIRDLEGAIHYFRNHTVDDVTNYTKDFSYALFETSVSYNSNIGEVIDVIKNLAHEFRQKEQYSKLILDNIEMLGLDNFADSAIIIKYRIKTKPAMQWIVYRGFNLALKERFDEKNIEIPFQQIVVNQPK